MMERFYYCFCPNPSQQFRFFDDARKTIVLQQKHPLTNSKQKNN